MKDVIGNIGFVEKGIVGNEPGLHAVDLQAVL